MNQPSFVVAGADFISLGDVGGGLAKMGEGLSFDQPGWAGHQQGMCLCVIAYGSITLALQSYEELHRERQVDQEKVASVQRC